MVLSSPLARAGAPKSAEQNNRTIDERSGCDAECLINKMSVRTLIPPPRRRSLFAPFRMRNMLRIERRQIDCCLKCLMFPAVSICVLDLFPTREREFFGLNRYFLCWFMCALLFCRFCRQRCCSLIGVRRSYIVNRLRALSCSKAA